MPSLVEYAESFPEFEDNMFEVPLLKMQDLPLSVQHHKSSFQETFLEQLKQSITSRWLVIKA